MILFTLTVGSVDCERVFSTMNLIKTDLRNRMGIGSLSSLLRVSRDGCPMEEYDPKPAVSEWSKKKVRRLNIEE